MGVADQKIDVADDWGLRCEFPDVGGEVALGLGVRFAHARVL